MKIRISGASDDLVEIDGDISDEISWPSGGPCTLDLIAPDGEAMRVHVLYGGEGCWHVAVGQIDEDRPLPSWPLRFEQGSSAGGTTDYTVVLEVEAPDGTRIESPDGVERS